MPRLLDHLVGQRHKIHRQFDARGFRGLEVDDQLEACRLLERQEGGPGATKDARGQIGGALKAGIRCAAA
jgi:hypothetical protein